MNLHSPRTDVVRLLVLALVCAVAGLGHLALAVDVENTAMDSVGTSEAAIRERREQEFGRDRTLVLLLEANDPDARAEPAARAFVARLRLDPAVGTAQIAPLGGRDARLILVDIAASADGRYADAAQRLLAHARAQVPDGFRLAVTGLPAGKLAVANALVAEQRRIVPTVAGVLFLLLLVVYRRLAYAVGAMVPALGGIAAIGGVQYLAGIAIDPIAALLDPVLLTVGVAGSVHLIEAFRARCAEGLDPAAASRAAVRRIRVPATLAVVTTVAGFVGLLPNPIPAVGRFGVLASVGVVLTMLFAFVALPPWLRLFARGASGSPIARPPRRNAVRLVVAARFLARPLTAIAIVVSLAAGWEWGGLRVDNDPIRVMPASHPFRVDTDRVAARLGGIDTFELLLEAPQPPLSIGRVPMLIARVVGLPGVVAPAGPPREGSADSRLLGFVLKAGGSTDHEATFAAAESIAHELGFVAAHATGPAVTAARDSSALVKGQIRGLLFTFAFLWLAMAIGFRSVRTAFLGLVPNVLPCVLLYGGLAAIDRPLSVGSAMIGSVMLGLIVDNAIHFLHGYRRARQAGHGRTPALVRAFDETGRAITITGAVLACGFGSGLLGDLTTTREFGLLSSSTILIALAADFVLLPAVVLLFHPRHRRAR